MAHFRAEVIGSRETYASRCGTKKSGISAKVQTWGFDVVVNVMHCSKEVAAKDKTLGEGDWAVIELVRHGERYGTLVKRINLTTGEMI